MRSQRPMLLLAVIALGATSCDVGSAIRESVDQAVSVIENGISDILADSTSWQSTLREVANQLPSDISEVIRTDAQNLANRSIAQAGTEFRCNVDFLAGRAVAGLRQLKGKLLGEEPAPLPPEFCHVVPPSIDLKTDPASWSHVTLHGYDLDHKDGTGAKLAFFLLDRAGRRLLIPESRVGRTTHYQVTLNIGGMASQLHGAGVRKIVCAWGGSSDLLPEVVVVPWEPRTKTESVSPAATTFMPPHVRGDGNFNTHDDEHMSVDVRGQIEVVGKRTVRSRVYMRAREERSDWTEVKGWSDWASVYAAPQGWTIVEVRPDAASRHGANITSHGRHQYDRPAGEVVARFEVWGDRSGDEAGTWTHMSASWRPLIVTIRETAPQWLQ